AGWPQAAQANGALASASCSVPPTSRSASGEQPVPPGRLAKPPSGRRTVRPRATIPSGRSGGTGRRAGLKIRWPSGRVGSIPTFGTRNRSGDRTETRCTDGPARMRAMASRVGILTGGGDCPGLNAVIRAVARRSLDRGWDVVGVREGWRGLVEGKYDAPLGYREISGLLPRGGTI